MISGLVNEWASGLVKNNISSEGLKSTAQRNALC
jgi:hypothetical protein